MVVEICIFETWATYKPPKTKFMQRRDFFRNSAFTALGAGIVIPSLSCSDNGTKNEGTSQSKSAKNIIFMVSDGMSSGTLNMADLLMQRKFGKGSNWINLYRENKVRRALMDTASASSLVTDSAAASSAWGGGVRVPNGRINVGANDERYKPILQKFKEAGKSVGCVTTVPITHATPAGFCTNSKSRNSQPEIAEHYLSLRFDVMLGGGLEHFDGTLREDAKDLIADYRANAFALALSKAELMEIPEGGNPVMGVFHSDGLPYSLDQSQDQKLIEHVPTLAEMTKYAIERMKDNTAGFVMQVEGGKVDWAAHATDAGALLYDQLAFDEAVKVAIDFAEKDGNTLVVITTDHGNANPGLFYGSKANDNFDRVINFKQTNEWILKGFDSSTSDAQIKERIEYAQGYVITDEEAAELKTYFKKIDGDSLYNPYKLPFRPLAQMQTKYTSIGWAGDNHSADFVELAMLGPGSELLPAFVKNTDLHEFMLKVTSLQV